MSVNRFQDWVKQNQRMHQELDKSSQTWDETPDSNLEERKKITQQWKQEQKVVVNKIRQEKFEGKNIKTVSRYLAIVTVIAVIVPNIPDYFRFGKQKLAEMFPPEQKVVFQGDNSHSQGSKKGTLLKKLKELQSKNQQKNCKPTANTPFQPSNPTEKVALKEQVNQSITNIDKYNKNLKSAMDMSDGKEFNPCQNK